MSIDGEGNLIVKIEGKTQSITPEEIKRAFSFQNYLKREKGKKIMCANYERDNVEEKLDVSSPIKPDHYNKFKITPINFILANEIPFCEANALKYLCRWRDKGGVTDLEKAIEYINILIKNEENGTK